MKKLCLIVAAVFALVVGVSEVSAKTVYIWRYGHALQRGWVQQPDAFGGDQFWCVGPGASCGEYDWKAIYGSFKPHLNNPYLAQPLFAIDQMVLNAPTMGIQLPPVSEFENPDIEITVE